MSYVAKWESADADEVLRLMRSAGSRAAFQRLQCVWLRFELGMGAKEVSRVTGLSVPSVKKIQSIYVRDGAGAVIPGEKGGRQRENMAPDRELELVEWFVDGLLRGRICGVRELCDEYEKRTGGAATKSTVYRMLKRNSWFALRLIIKNASGDII